MVEETRESPISEAPAAAEKPLEPPLSDASLNPTSTSGVSTETLAARRSSPRPLAVAAPDRRSFSQLLASAMASPVFSAAVPCFLSPDSPGFKGQFAMTHQAVLATVTAQAQMQLQAMHSASSEVSTNIFSKPISPVPDQKPQSKQTVVNTNSVGDGYNWRKYGQKLVKSSENSRSYYKCTDPNCSAKKKVERCHDGRVTEMTYMDHHNHGPPQQTKCSRERGPRSNGPPGESESLDIPSSEMNDPDSSNAKMDQISGNGTPEQQLFCSSDCERDARIRIKEELGDRPEPKRRLVQNILTFSPSPRVLKEPPKVIVHEESDVGRAGDGYKWRKYGQKIVKGNPNPRSYYRCSHNGCPVRKHVERASDDVKATIVTYEGKHNHDQPSPMTNSDLPASPLPLASMAMPYEQLQPPDNSPVDQKPSTVSPTDIGSGSTIEKASELGERALQSAGDNCGGSNPDG